MALSKFSESTDTFDAEELIALARLDIERGQLDEALWKIKQALKAPSPPAEGLAMGARLYAQLGLFDRAKDLFERYLNLEPDAINEAFQLGMVHFDAGQMQEAKKLWDELLTKFPTHPPAMFFRALIMARENDTVQAGQLLDKLLKTVPADNLYFERAKELLQSIQSGQTPATRPKVNGVQKEPTRVAAKDAYKTEH